VITETSVEIKPFNVKMLPRPWQSFGKAPKPKDTNAKV